MVGAETVHVDDFAVDRVTAAVSIAVIVCRRGPACFEDVGFLALTPHVEGLRCATHFFFLGVPLLLELGMREKMRWLGSSAARGFPF